MANNKVLSQLMLDAYNPRKGRAGYGDFKPFGPGQDLPNGLRIQAYVNETTKEVVIGAGGTDGFSDVIPDANFVFGGYGDQFYQAVKYANDIRGIFGEGPGGYNYSVTGHSLGGGIAQVLSNTYGWNGSTFDAPAASAVIYSDGYKAQLLELGTTAKGPGQLTNYTEQGSIVSSVPFRDYIGQEVGLNLTADGESWLGGALLAQPHPLGKLVGAGMVVNDQWLSDGQHNASKFADFFSNPQDPGNVDGYRYIEGTYNGWYSVAPDRAIGRNDWSGRASPEKAAELNAERARRLEHNRSLIQESDSAQGNNQPSVAAPISGSTASAGNASLAAQRVQAGETPTGEPLNEWISEPNSSARHIWVRNSDGSLTQVVDAGNGKVVENHFSGTTGERDLVRLHDNTAGTSTTVMDNRPPVMGESYTIQSGDTLSAIAKRSGVTVDDLLDANPGITDPDMIRAGDGLNIPTGKRAEAEQAGNADESIASSAPIEPTEVTLPDGTQASVYIEPGKATTFYDDTTGKTYLVSADGSTRELTYEEAYGEGEIVPASYTTEEGASAQPTPEAESSANESRESSTKEQDAQTRAEVQALSSILTLYQAIQGEDNLAIGAAGASTILAFDRLDGTATNTTIGWAAGLGAIAAGMNLDNALENGDNFGALVAGSNLVYQGATFTAAVTEGAVSQAASNVANGIGQYLGALGIAYSLSQGDTTGAVIAAISIAFPVVGLILSVCSMLFAEEPPDVKGTAVATWDEHGNLTTKITEDEEGGGETANNALKGMLGTLEAILATQTDNTGESATATSLSRGPRLDPIGEPLYAVVPQRLPSVSFFYRSEADLILNYTESANSGRFDVSAHAGVCARVAA